MNRKTFLNNIFGAAVIAAIPKPVFDAIVAQEERFIPPLVLKPNLTPGYLYLFDEDKLLAFSKHFSIETHIDQPDVSTMDDFTPRFIRSKLEWFIKTEWLEVLENMNEYIYGLKPIKAIVRKDKFEFFGDVLFYESTISSDFIGQINQSAKFIGLGALTLTRDLNE